MYECGGSAMSALYPRTLQRSGNFLLGERVVTPFGDAAHVETITFRWIVARCDRGHSWIGDPTELRHEIAEFWEAAE